MDFPVIHKHTFSGAPAKLRKATISFIMCVCPSVRLSVRMENLGSHWTDYREISYLRIFRKLVEKMQVSLKVDEKRVYCACMPKEIYDNISLNSY
jgi:hypothetical protein